MIRAVASEELVKTTAQWIPRLGMGLMIVLGFLIAAALASKLFARVIGHARPSKQVVLRLLLRTAKMTLVTVGVTVALGTMGVNVSAIVAGLGLTGFALGFALKDAISNVISGVMILLYHTLEIGDSIVVAGLEGVVADIDLRYTVLEKDGRRILIPNSNLVTNPIVITRGAARV